MDNYTWVELKNEFNDSNKNQVLSYDSFYNSDKNRYLNILLKLGYIKREFVYKHGNVRMGSFSRVKHIPVGLTWKDAKEEAKTLNVNLKKQVRKYTLWNHIVEKINDCDKETFNVYDIFPLNKYGQGIDLYICKIYKLGYIERLDRHRNYKKVGKIPENLSSAMANKMLYDKIYKRARKIQLLKEKMAS